VHSLYGVVLLCGVIQQGAESRRQDTEQSAREPQGDWASLYPGDARVYRETQRGGY